MFFSGGKLKKLIKLQKVCIGLIAGMFVLQSVWFGLYVYSNPSTLSVDSITKAATELVSFEN